MKIVFLYGAIAGFYASTLIFFLWFGFVAKVEVKLVELYNLALAGMLPLVAVAFAHHFTRRDSRLAKKRKIIVELIAGLEPLHENLRSQIQSFVQDPYTLQAERPRIQLKIRDMTSRLDVILDTMPMLHNIQRVERHLGNLNDILATSTAWFASSQAHAFTEKEKQNIERVHGLIESAIIQSKLEAIDVIAE